MSNRTLLLVAGIVVGSVWGLAVGAAYGASGKIVCWKDKSGKIVGCGDTVPPEYREGGTKELDRRGVTRKETGAALTAEQRKAKEEEEARKKAEAQKAQEQRRQDTALLNTFSSEKEIDLKRDRELQVVDLQIKNYEASLKNAQARETEARGRADQITKSKKPLPDAVKDELARAEAERRQIEGQITTKQKERDAIRVKYEEMKKRYAELKAKQAAARGK